MAAVLDPLANVGGLQAFKPIIAAILTIMFAVLGCFLFGTVGSMAYPGIGAIIGAMLGFLIMGCCGCFISGLWKEAANAYVPTIHPRNLMPAAANFAIGGHGTFDCVCTVHKIENLTVLGRVFQRGDLYVTIEVGDNPKKSTCVKPTGEWNEQFRLRIKPADDTILVRILDQDFFGSTALGYRAVEVQSIVDRERGFPTQERFDLTLNPKKASPTEDGQKAAIVLSFHPADGFPKSAMNDMPQAYQDGHDGRALKSQSEQKSMFAEKKGYGSMSRQFTKSEQQLGADAAAG